MESIVILYAISWSILGLPVRSAFALNVLQAIINFQYFSPLTSTVKQS